VKAHAGIRCDDVWKRFRRGQRHNTLRDLLPALAGRALGRGPAGASDFWALRAVSFEVAPGEVLGIIGPNGAGKSTLLKLLAGVLAPTRGAVDVHGRVGALIELAAGFHSELTGRENIYLQGAIMGMPRSEIDGKFDRIVAFSEIEDFLDTQVKRYSSGMAARLGFAIAAHLDPDVLLIDEVLSVGDQAFQTRANRRIREIVERGIPVVLVSHHLERVKELASHAVLLAGGGMVHQGAPGDCVARYLRGDYLPGPAGEVVLPVRLDGFEGPAAAVRAGDRVTFSIRGEALRAPEADLTVGLLIRRVADEELVFATHAELFDIPIPTAGTFTLETDVTLWLGPGRYRAQPMIYDRIADRQLARGFSHEIMVERAPTSYGSTHLDSVMRRVE